jgi:hypothetical protein
MSKRMLDDAIWESDKIARCRPHSKAEYLWLYLLADPYGNFELNIKAIRNRAYGLVRPEITEDMVGSFLADFERVGLLYTWTENRKQYGHWTGCEKPGRLPSPLGINDGERGKYASLPVRRFYAYSKTKAGFKADIVDPGLQHYLDSVEETFKEKQISFPVDVPDQETEQEQEQVLPSDLCAHCQKPFQEIVPLVLFHSFMRMRAGKNKKNTPDAINLFRRNLLTWHSEGQDVIEIIERAVRNSWTDLYPLKNGNGSGVHTENRPQLQFVTSEFGPRKPRSAETQAAIEAIGKKFLEQS